MPLVASAPVQPSRTVVRPVLMAEPETKRCFGAVAVGGVVSSGGGGGGGSNSAAAPIGAQSKIAPIVDMLAPFAGDVRAGSCGATTRVRLTDRPPCRRAFTGVRRQSIGPKPKSSPMSAPAQGVLLATRH